jgi:hypothetical protein
VIPSDASPITPAAIKACIDRFETEDDVFNEQFTTSGYLVVQQSARVKPAPELPKDVIEYLNVSSTTILFLDSFLPEGAYFGVGRDIHQAWRLYPGEFAVFTTAVIPDDETTGAGHNHKVILRREEIVLTKKGIKRSMLLLSPTRSRASHFHLDSTSRRPRTALYQG